MKKLISISLVYLAFTSVISAQQSLITNEYLINSFALSPALAGLNNSTEVFTSYRKNWSGFENAPKLASLSAHTALGLHHGVGIKVQSSKAGIFSNFNTSLTYAYHVKVGEKSMLSFGIAAGIKNFYIDLSDESVLEDPFVGGSQMLNRNVSDAEFGIDFTCKNFAVGFSIPQLTGGVISNSNQNDILVLKRQYRGYLMKTFVINRNLQAQPIVVVNKTENYLMYDVNALLKFKNQLWIGGSYKSTNAIGAMIGIQYKRIIFNYTYEFSSKGILGVSGGTNDITVGFLLGKNNPKLTEPSILKSLQCKPPYTNWQ